MRKHKSTPHGGTITLWGIIRVKRLNWLLVFLPISIVLELLHQSEVSIFITSALAIVPLAGLIGDATEQLAERTGPGMGGFLNATFGNATELIIAFLALRAGLVEVVKASISGSIIGNILLVLGVSMLVGGWGRHKQVFSRTAAGASSAMLFLAVVALIMPAVYDLAVYHTLEKAPPALLTLLVSVVLLLTYLASLVFSLRTHQVVLDSTPEEPEQHPCLSLPNAVILLLAATVLTAIAAELLVGTIAEASRLLGMTEFFVGVIVVAIIGNAAEHFTAVVMARKNKMELAVTIATSSSTQIALFVAPVLVFASFLLGNPMSLVFNGFEIAGIALSVLALAIISLDGESTWFEGFQLVALYAILAIVFYFVRIPVG